MPDDERLLLSVRRACLDRFLILHEKQRHRPLKHDVQYFNQARPHQGLRQRIAEPLLLSAPSPNQSGQVFSFPVLGGLHHDDQKAAEVLKSVLGCEWVRHARMRNVMGSGLSHVFRFPPLLCTLRTRQTRRFLPCSQGIFMQARLQTERVGLNFASSSMYFTREKGEKRNIALMQTASF
jgi:hypothetical protein